MTEEAQNTISQISALIDSLTTQCNQLNKDEHKEQLVDFKQQIRKLESKLSVILPDTKVPIGLNGEKSLDRLKARAARFGVESDEVKKVVDDEKKSKRKERFNLESGSEATSDDAKKRRLARFGGN